MTSPLCNYFVARQAVPPSKWFFSSRNGPTPSFITSTKHVEATQDLFQISVYILQGQTVKATLTPQTSFLFSNLTNWNYFSRNLSSVKFLSDAWTAGTPFEWQVRLQLINPKDNLEWDRWKSLNPVRKAWLQIKEDLGQKVTGSKLSASKDSLLWNLYPLKCTLPLAICIHNVHSFVRCFDWLYFWFMCERCNMSSINKRSTWVVATFKKYRNGTWHKWELQDNTQEPWLLLRVA